MEPSRTRCAAIVTVGSELLDGIGLDTNTREVAHALATAGYRVDEADSIPDDRVALAQTLRRLASSHL